MNVCMPSVGRACKCTLYSLIGVPFKLIRLGNSEFEFKFLCQECDVLCPFSSSYSEHNTFSCLSYLGLPTLLCRYYQTRNLNICTYLHLSCTHNRFTHTQI
jgi:hypothetical protein